MAVVPARRTVQTQAAPFVPLSSRGATAAAFGGAEGAALEGLGNQIQQSGQLVADAMIRQQLEDNETEGKQLDVEYATGLQLLAQGDGTPGNLGFEGLQGQDAVRGYDAYRARQEALRADILGRASNPRVAEDFGFSADQRDLAQRNSDLTYLQAEREAAHKGASNARVGVAVDEAVRNFNDPVVIESSLSVVEGEANSRANREGLDEVQTQVRVETARGLVIKGAFDAAMGEEKYEVAAAIYERYAGAEEAGKKIPASVLAEMQAGLLEGRSRVVAQYLSDKAFELFPDDPVAAAEWIAENASGITENRALSRFQVLFGIARSVEADVRARNAEARAERGEDRAIDSYEYDVVQRAVRLSEQIFREDVRRRERLIREAGEKAEAHVKAGGNPDELSAAIKSHLSLEKIESLDRAYARGQSGIPYNTDWDYYAAVTHSDNTDKLPDIDLGDAETKLAPAEFTVVRNLVTDARINANAPEASLITVTQMLDARFDELGLESRSATDVKTMGQIKTAFYMALSLADKANGPNVGVGYVEQVKILEDVMATKDLGTSWWRRLPSPEWPPLNLITPFPGLFTTLPETPDAVTTAGSAFVIPPITEEARAGAIAALARKGVTDPTEEQIQTLYEDTVRDRQTDLPPEPTPPADPTGPTDLSDTFSEVISNLLISSARADEPTSLTPSTSAELAQAMAKSDYSFPAGIDEITSKSILFTLGNEGRGEEGRSGKLYYDTSKPPIPTIGIGFNLNRDGARATIEAAGLNYDDILAGKVTLTNEQMDKLFLADIRDAQKSAKRIFSDWDKFSDDRQVALTDMILNLGVGKFTGFDKMVRAIKSGNWKAAANEAVKSNWFTQVKDRGPRVVALLRGGDETPSAISRPKSKPSTPAELDLAKLVSAGVIPDPAPEWLRRAMDPSTPTTGQNETVQTASFYSEKHGGTLLVPTIRMGANGLFKPEDPVAEAIRRDDFILVPGPPGDATEARATALSRFISDMLIAKARAK